MLYLSPRRRGRQYSAGGPTLSQRASKVDEHPAFGKAVADLDPKTREQIEALVQTFTYKWESGATIQELRENWRYKPVARGRRQAIQEIYLNRNYRAFVTHVSQRNTLYLLELFKKSGSPKAQNAAIDRAMTRASAIREDL